MNREIKFKAWDSSNKNWLTDKDNVFINEEGVCFILVRGAASDYLSTVDVGICLYTGLKDKNGKEIYEGDLCNLIPFEDNKNNEHMIGVRQVIWENTHACFYFSGWVPLHWGVFESIEIIGNIYENPELVK